MRRSRLSCFARHDRRAAPCDTDRDNAVLRGGDPWLHDDTEGGVLDFVAAAVTCTLAGTPTGLRAPQDRQS